MMKLTTTLLMMVMNASSPDPGGHSHTDLCFYIVYNIHSHLGLAQQVVYLVPAGFTTCWLSGQFSPRRQPSRSRIQTLAGCARSR